MSEHGMAMDGYNKAPVVTEGHQNKGGANNAASQIQTRPPDPPPLRPASAPQVTGETPANGASKG